MSPLREQMLKTADAYAKAHVEHDLKAITALCTSGCVHRMGPSPLKAPARSNEEYEALHVEAFKLIPKEEAYHARDPVVDEVTRHVIFYMNTTGETSAGKYENEQIFTFKMNKEGTLIEEQYDFIDSKTMLDWIAKWGDSTKDAWEGK